MSSPVEDMQNTAATSAVDEESSKMEVDPFTTPVSANFEFPEDGVRRMSVDASGRVVIEELDTPYTRRQKSMKRKAEKQKVAEPSEGPATAEEAHDGVIPPSVPSTTPTSEAAPPTRRGHRKVSIEVPEDAGESESELSELSDLPDDATPASETGPSSSKQPNPMRKKPTEARRKKSKRVSQNYESGTLVWAKAGKGFPRVVDPAHLSSDLSLRFTQIPTRGGQQSYSMQTMLTFLPMCSLISWASESGGKSSSTSSGFMTL
jgi:hypothetical protein